MLWAYETIDVVRPALEFLEGFLWMIVLDLSFGIGAPVALSLYKSDFVAIVALSNGATL